MNRKVVWERRTIMLYIMSSRNETCQAAQLLVLMACIVHRMAAIQSLSPALWETAMCDWHIYTQRSVSNQGVAI